MKPGLATPGVLGVFSRQVVGDFEAAGSAHEWRRCMYRGVVPTMDLDLASHDLQLLAEQRPLVCPEPTFGATICQILDKEAPTDEWSGGPTDERPRRGHDWLHEPRTVGPATRDRLGPSPRVRDRRTPPHAAHGAVSEHQNAREPRDPAAVVRDLPKRRVQKSLANVAGQVPPPLAGDRKRRVDERGSRPPVERLAPPAKDGGLDRAIQRVGRRFDIDSPIWQEGMAHSVPRPGPHMSTDKLVALVFGDAISAARVANAPGEPNAGDGPIHPDEVKPAVEPWKQPADIPARSTEGRPQTAAFPESTPDIRSGTAPVEQSEAIDVRRVTSHQELPAVPRRERSSGVPTGQSGRLSAPAAFGELANQAPTESESSHGADLENRMKAILDEAARRHGIEV